MAQILVIDDDELCRRTVSNMLEQSGYEVSLAEDGQDGLDVALSNPPDLIICDVDMPRLDGFAVVRSLRADAKTEAIPIIFITGLTKEEASRRGGDAPGSDDILIKPFTRSSFLSTVKERLARFGKTRKGEE
jgi:DNA-binding response OmpR family regulator